MSSGLRARADPGLYFVSIDADSSPHYTLNTETGKWTDATANFSNKVFKDLGKIIYYDPVESLAASGTRIAPPVDVRKVAELTAQGVESTGTVYYVPLGTRVRGTRAQQANIPSCWIAQVAASVASLRSGGAASGSA